VPVVLGAPGLPYSPVVRESMRRSPELVPMLGAPLSSCLVQADEARASAAIKVTPKNIFIITSSQRVSSFFGRRRLV
jgi:hypothetical protein